MADAQTPYVGQIVAVAFNFAPENWALCNGQLIPITEYSTLYNLIGTTYGGDGQTTFGLPDLRGRAPVHMGQGTGLSSYVIGQFGGQEAVTLTAAQNASHTHAVNASSQAGTTSTPSNAVSLATASAAPLPVYAPPGTTVVSMAPAAIGSSGSGQPHDNRQPYLAINYIIALYGEYPSQ
jgi:microcystin-dependent protein